MWEDEPMETLANEGSIGCIQTYRVSGNAWMHCAIKLNLESSLAKQPGKMENLVKQEKTYLHFTITKKFL